MKLIIKKLPKISIITVCLNSEKTIERCIKSVHNQNYRKNNIQHVVIDGKSIDNTIKIIKKYKNKISYWNSKKDLGLYYAMNNGLKHCNGDIIGILNSDDYFYKNTFNIVAKYFNENNIDFLFGSVNKKKKYHNIYLDKLWYKFNIFPSHSVSFFITRKAQKRIGKYNTKFKYSADRDLFYRMIKKNKLHGMATKKNEVFGKFNLSGLSSKVGYFRTLFEELNVRFHNKQNIVFLIILFFANILNKIINLLFKK